MSPFILVFGFPGYGQRLHHQIMTSFGWKVLGVCGVDKWANPMLGPPCPGEVREAMSVLWNWIPGREASCWDEEMEPGNT